MHCDGPILKEQSSETIVSGESVWFRLGNGNMKLSIKAVHHSTSSSHQQHLKMCLKFSTHGLHKELDKGSSSLTKKLTTGRGRFSVWFAVPVFYSKPKTRRELYDASKQFEKLQNHISSRMRRDSLDWIVT